MRDPRETPSTTGQNNARDGARPLPYHGQTTVQQGPTRSRQADKTGTQVARAGDSGLTGRPQNAPRSRRLGALEQLIGMASAAWSDPAQEPAGDPPGLCLWPYDECETPAAVWRWEEPAGGWLPVCATHAPDQAEGEHRWSGIYCSECGCDDASSFADQPCPGFEEGAT